MNRSKRIKITLFVLYIAVSWLIFRIAFFAAGDFASGKQIKYLPWVECDFVTPKFGCFWSQ